MRRVKRLGLEVENFRVDYDDGLVTVTGKAADLLPPGSERAGEYASGHIPGAVSMPTDQLERRLSELPRDREIVAYCRGPYCVLAVRAVDALRVAGFKARRMEVGLPEWRAQGLAVVEAAAPKSDSHA